MSADLDAYVAALQQALTELRKTRAYAFAHGHQCSTGSDPRLDWVLLHEHFLKGLVNVAEGER